MKPCLSKAYVLLTFGPIIAWGQQIPAPAQANDELQEIVVTAQFRSENLQKAAIPIDVVSAADLQRAGVTSAEQLNSLVPALQISQSGAGVTSLFIRGVGTNASNSYTDPGVAFNVDGIYIGRPSSITDIFFDLDRVEVLKGPQGTLYGRNATGGAINVLPALPKLEETSGYMLASYGNYDAEQIEGAVNLPIGSEMAARISGTAIHHDGYLSDHTNDADNYAFRGQLLYAASDQLSIRLSGDFAHDGGKGNGSTLIGYVSPFTGQGTQNPVSRRIGIEDPQIASIFGSQYSFLSGRFGEGVTDTPSTDNRFNGIKAQLNGDLGFATLTTLAAYRSSDRHSLDFGFGFPAYTDEHAHQTSVEIRLAGRDEGMLRWLVGGYYYNEGITSDYNFNESSVDAFQSFGTGTKSEAGFARLTFSPIESLRFVGGVRYTTETKNLDGLSSVFLDICTNPTVPIPACPGAPLFPFAATPQQLIGNMGLIQVAPGPPPVYIQPTAQAAHTIFVSDLIPINDSLKTDKTTFRLAVEYDLADQSLLYASFEDGFHAGGFAFAESAPTFRPEEIDAWTIGSKNRFLNSTLQINAEAFLWKYKDQQISHFITDTSGADVFATSNAGSSTNKGIEVDVHYKPLPNTLLGLDAQYLKATYDQFTYTAPTAPSPLITGCLTTPTGTNQAIVNCSGKPALHSPEWTINLGLEQRFPIGNSRITFAANTHYQARNVIGFEMLPGISEQAAYSMTDLTLNFGPNNDKWSIGLFVNNVEDRLPIGQSFYNSVAQTYAASPLPPRIFGLRGIYVW